MNERSRQLTIAALERAIADSATAPKIRRSCTLRLGRLRAATAKRPAITTRTKTAAPSAQACFEAHQAFVALAQQRRALFNKRRSAAEQNIFATMAALMPAAAPTDSEPKAWTDFVAQISGLLEEIKALR